MQLVRCFLLWDSTKPVLWTLGWTMDWTLDSILDLMFGLEFRSPRVRGQTKIIKSEVLT